MRKWLWLALAAVVIPSVVSADLTLDDFAYGIRFDVPGGTAIGAMSLPLQVYESAVSADLGDLRVFNANGEPVPHLLRHTLAQSDEPPWRSLVFFPFPEVVQPEAGGYRLFVQTGPDGAVVRVDPRALPASSEPARTFLIDLNPAEQRPAQLRLEWPALETNLMTTLAVDASDDLVDWTTVQPRIAIADIRYGGRRLISNTIPLPRSWQPYLRLRQLDSGPAIPLIRIDGRDHPEGRAPVRVFFKLDGRQVSGQPGVFEYLTGGAFPVDRANLIFDQANSVAEATLESRSDPKATWMRRFKGLFYRIDVDTASLTGSPQAVPISTDRHWRLTVNASDSTIGRAVPRLEIGYRPHDLYFIARGEGPFTLAFGSAMVEPLKVNVSGLFDGISRHRENGLERWMPPEGTPIILGGPQRLLPSPKPLPMRRIGLWSILVAGVLVVAVMAWRLARRLRRSRDTNSLFY